MADVYPSKEQLVATRTGIYSQLKATTNLVEIYGSLAMGIDVLGLGDFIENQVQVLASAHAWVHRTEMRLQKELHKHKPDTAEQMLEEAVFKLWVNNVSWNDIALKLERPLSVLLGYTGIMNLYLNPDKTTEFVQCSCTDCKNKATHSWSGHPTCDECGTPSRKNRS